MTNDCPPTTSDELRAELATVTAERNRLRLGARLAVGQIDRAFGDTDPRGPNHPLLKACEILSIALEPHPPDTVTSADGLTEAQLHIAENERLQSELATARETNGRLNRRCQVAERAASEKVTASTGSLGRGLANYAASMYARELTEAREENERLRTECGALFGATETLRVHLSTELGIPYEIANDSLIWGAVRRLVAEREGLRDAAQKLLGMIDTTDDSQRYRERFWSHLGYLKAALEPHPDGQGEK